MAKPYKELRKLMYAEGLTQADLAERLGRSPNYVNRRMRCDDEWDIREIYVILDLFDLQPADIHIYFPRAEAMRTA